MKLAQTSLWLDPTFSYLQKTQKTLRWQGIPMASLSWRHIPYRTVSWHADCVIIAGSQVCVDCGWPHCRQLQMAHLTNSISVCSVVEHAARSHVGLGVMQAETS